MRGHVGQTCCSDKKNRVVHTEATCSRDKITTCTCTHVKMLRVHVSGICYSDISPGMNMNMYPQHFHVSANVVILSLLHVPPTRAECMSPQCVPLTFLWLQMSLHHVPATWPLVSKQHGDFVAVDGC